MSREMASHQIAPRNPHRLPVVAGDQLHFRPAYLIRFVVAWLIVFTWLILFLISLANPSFLSMGTFDPGVARRLLGLGAFLVLGGAGTMMRGQYLCLDPRSGSILKAPGLSGYIFPWKPVYSFSLSGTLRFQFCEYELQSLCVLSYQHPGSQDWLVLHIYNNQKTAAEAASRVRRWAPGLNVIEVRDQEALATVRSVKPVVT